ncbi:DUF6479 family protein [Streptomyces oceani]|uniref:Secreted protein n=1 Tax=Streptomyces oceani TaxID=1075402 RepID=A0A1E7KH01_9ACTN|nr:DUF6479 family protein [Streptomyces oceani]OEV03209.1 hypothetical protein AN216_12765 [Streptomyces oceani]
MDTVQIPLAVARDFLVGLAPLILGLVIVAALILAVAYGMRLRQRGDARASQAAPPHEHHPEDYDPEVRAPAEMPHDGKRRLPHELKDHGNTGTESGGTEAEPPRWNEGGSGSFGSGGPGGRHR